MARIRTAKQLGSRHDRNYFRHWTAGRKWRVGLSIVCPVLVVAWLVGHAVTGSSVPYSSGPLSHAHAIFGNNCEACHVVRKNIFGTVSFQKQVTDQACEGCHEAPEHHGNAVETVKCASCHVEHRGADLVRVEDASCARCHGHLRTKNGELKYASSVSSFARTHPDFAAVTSGRDAGGIKLNHEIHLRSDLRAPDGATVKLECSDCHRAVADANTPWRFGDGAPRAGTASDLKEPEMTGVQDAVDPARGRSYIAPVKFASHCAACHELHFDPRMNEAVPHGKKPEEVHAFLQDRYRAYLGSHPGAWRETPPRLWMIPGQADLRIARSAEEWQQIQTEQAELLLWRKTCKLCHTLQFKEDGQLPQIQPANLRARWLPHSTFSHYAHQAVACDSCHGGVRHSKETADVLIPGIVTCRECHTAKATAVGQTESGCSLCHQYHDWKNRKPGLKGAFTIEELLAKKTK